MAILGFWEQVLIEIFLTIFYPEIFFLTDLYRILEKNKCFIIQYRFHCISYDRGTLLLQGENTVSYRGTKWQFTEYLHFLIKNHRYSTYLSLFFLFIIYLSILSSKVFSIYHRWALCHHSLRHLFDWWINGDKVIPSISKVQYYHRIDPSKTNTRRFSDCWVHIYFQQQPRSSERLLSL